MAPRTGWHLRRLHKLLAMVIGVQFLFWTASGLFFTLYPIEEIRGQHLRAEIDHGTLPADALPINDAAARARSVGEVVTGVELRMFLGDPVWIVRSDTTVRMVDALNGKILSPVSEGRAMQVAQAGYTGTIADEASAKLLVSNPPREYAGPLPAWKINTKANGHTLYIDASTGDLVTIRTMKWRVFDVLWRFHIMDVTGKDTFTTWWMKLAAFAALTLVLLGFALLIDRARKKRLLG